MINLLPTEEKRKLLLEKKKKLAVILGIMVLVFLICLTLILLSIKFYISSDVNYQNILLKQAQLENQTPEFMSLNDSVEKYNKSLAQLDLFYKTEAYFSKAMEAAMSVKNDSGLYFRNFYLSRDDSGAIIANISGISDTRDGLLIFKKNIEASKEIKNPYFSPDSWTSPTNANFSLKFEINYKNEE